MADDLAARLSLVETLLSDLQAEVVDLRSENGRLRSAHPADEGSPTSEPTPLGRRRLLVGGATAGAAAVAGLVASAPPAAADDGDALDLGSLANTATNTTRLTADIANDDVFQVKGTGTTRTIIGTATGGVAVAGEATSGVAVSGEVDGGVAIRAISTSGTALLLDGGACHALLQGLGRNPPPQDGIAHLVGELVVDENGDLWHCGDTGIPGVWRKLGGPGTAGQLHVLPAPRRVYDSRPGSPPSAIGPKTRFAANETRTFDLKANSSGVPAGATAALVTILLVNASTTAGNATIWANGVAKPVANSMVWGGTAGRFTATAVTALDGLARVRFNASQTTDLVLDVVGYYR